ncbi:MAG: glycosyltransferase family 4 protein [Myxococcota bacterium]
MGRLLVVSQVYPPESAAVGQYLADLAEHIVQTGRPVTVLTSAAGYTDPSERYPAREMLNGVDVIRLPASSFGKASIPARLAGAGAFLGQAMVRALRVDDIDHALVSTSPPMAALAGLAVAQILRVPFTYWVMDINPDQAVTMGHFPSWHPAVRAFDRFNSVVLRRADSVVTLDSYMGQRLRRKYDRPIEVIPPWPLDGVAEPVDHADNPFRRAQGWNDKTVIMFSGNMSATSPIDTMVEAAYALKHRGDIVFAFIGGGDGLRLLKGRLREAPLSNVAVLPYQPRSELRYSLSAADAHVATMGEAMVGITHPCKVYTAMAVARPLLAVAPRNSHIGELAEGGGWQVAQGDVAGFAASVTELASLSPAERQALGQRNLARTLNAAALRERMAALVS